MEDSDGVLFLILIGIGVVAGITMLATMHFTQEHYRAMSNEYVLKCVEDGGVYQAPYSLTVGAACKYPERNVYYD